MSKTLAVWNWCLDGNAWLDALGRSLAVFLVTTLVWVWVHQRELAAGLQIAFELSNDQVVEVTQGDYKPMVKGRGKK